MAGFLVDQQLPARLATHLKERGHHAQHIKEYPGGVTLADVEITRIADAKDWAVVTKDEDFRISHLLTKQPERLVYITCGNISTPGLIGLVDEHYDAFVYAAESYKYIELNRSGVLVHDRR